MPNSPPSDPDEIRQIPREDEQIIDVNSQPSLQLLDDSCDTNHPKGKIPHPSVMAESAESQKIGMVQWIDLCLPIILGFSYFVHQQIDASLSLSPSTPALVEFRILQAFGACGATILVQHKGAGLILSASLFITGLLTSSAYVVLRFGPHCEGFLSDDCRPSSATLAYLALYAVVSSALLPVIFLIVECYDSSAQRFFCFIWGVGAPLGLAVWTLIHDRCKPITFALEEENRVDDVVVRLEGLCVSVISLSIPSLLHFPRPARIAWSKNYGCVSWKRWLKRAMRKCIRVKAFLKDPQICFLFAFSLTHGLLPTTSLYACDASTYYHLLSLFHYLIYVTIAGYVMYWHLKFLGISLILEIISFSISTALGRTVAKLGLFETQSMGIICLGRIDAPDGSSSNRRASNIATVLLAYHLGQALALPLEHYEFGIRIFAIMAKSFSLGLYVFWLSPERTKAKIYGFLTL